MDLIAGDSTNGLIPALNLQILEDDRHHFPPYDAVPVFNTTSLRRHPELAEVIESLAGHLPASTMQRLNAAVDLEHRSPEQVIRQWRRQALPQADTPQPEGPRQAGAPQRRQWPAALPACGQRVKPALDQLRQRR